MSLAPSRIPGAEEGEIWLLYDPISGRLERPIPYQSKIVSVVSIKTIVFPEQLVQKVDQFFVVASIQKRKNIEQQRMA